MKTRKFFIHNNDLEGAKWGFCHTPVYLCRGKCIDQYHFQRGKNGQADITEMDLLYVNEADLPENAEIPIYFSLDPKKHEVLQWFTPSLGEKISAKLPDDIIICNAVCDTEMYEPLPLTGTMETCFRKGKGARLITNLNLHPEFDGYMAPGKLFFPDHAFSDAREGKAHIDLSSVKEFSTYGFVNGEMDKYE